MASAALSGARGFFCEYGHWRHLLGNFSKPKSLEYSEVFELRRRQGEMVDKL